MRNRLANSGSNGMKEETIENILGKLVRMCGLGDIIGDVESVSGGLMRK